jgi:esterase
MCAARGAVALARSVSLHGVGSGLPLVMLHGALAAGSTYASLLRRDDCAPSAAKRVAPDLRGHGRSPHAASYSFSDMAEDVAALLHDLSGPAEGRSDICGHSMGGKVAMALALKQPHLVRRLVIVDIAPVDYRDEIRSRAKESGHVGVPLIAVRAMCAVEDGLRVGKYPRREDVDRALELHGVEDQDVRLFVATNLVPTAQNGKWTWRCDVHGIKNAMERTDAAGLLGFDIGVSEVSTSSTEKDPASHTPAVFQGPTLFVTGGRSSYVRRDRDQEAISRYFPNSSIVTLEHSGHWLQSENPRGFCKELTEFLES